MLRDVNGHAEETKRPTSDTMSLTFATCPQLDPSARPWYRLPDDAPLGCCLDSFVRNTEDAIPLEHGLVLWYSWENSSWMSPATPPGIPLGAIVHVVLGVAY